MFDSFRVVVLVSRALVGWRSESGEGWEIGWKAQ